jgi:hypothetical protein
MSGRSQISGFQAFSKRGEYRLKQGIGTFVLSSRCPQCCQIDRGAQFP